jgi:hypothetical protein
MSEKTASCATQRVIWTLTCQPEPGFPHGVPEGVVPGKTKERKWNKGGKKGFQSVIIIISGLLHETPSLKKSFLVIGIAEPETGC